MKTFSLLLAAAAVSVLAAVGCAAPAGDEDTGTVSARMEKASGAEGIDCHFTQQGCSGDWNPGGGGGSSAGSSSSGGTKHRTQPLTPPETPPNGNEDDPDLISGGHETSLDPVGGYTLPIGGHAPGEHRPSCALRCASTPAGKERDQCISRCEQL